MGQPKSRSIAARLDVDNLPHVQASRFSEGKAAD